MRVLYIGGTGEISLACVWESVRRGHEVTVFNRGQNKEPLPPGVTILNGTVGDDSSYRALGGNQYDVVCQFLAYHPDLVRLDLELFSGRCGQYVFISSASAYQKPARSTFITEQVPLVNPFWPYSQAKIQMEQLCLEAHASGRLPVTIVRPSHTYRRRIPSFLGSGDLVAWRMLQGKPVPVPGDGTTLWTLTHSDDFARGFCGLLGESRAFGEAFHITNHLHANTWIEIHETLANVLDVEARLAPVLSGKMMSLRQEWTGPLWGDKSWCAIFDNSKLFRLTGTVVPQVTLKEGFSRAVAVFRNERLPSFLPDEATNRLLDEITAAT